MYPYIPFFGNKIYTIGIGIVLSIIAFLIIVRYYTKKYSLPYNVFFSKFYLFLIIPYLLSRYISSGFGEGFYFPFSPVEFFYVVSPIGYKFHFVGLSWGIFLATILFFKYINRNKLKRLEILFYGLSAGTIVLGIFLLLGETFIGRQADSAMAISTSFKDSIVYDLDKVYPSGLILSILTGIWFFIIKIFSQKNSKKSILVAFIGMIIIYNLVLFFTSYDKFLPKSFLGFNADINTYSSIVLIIVLIMFFKRLKNE